MRNVLLCVAVLALTACGGDGKGAATPDKQLQPWADFLAATMDEYYRRSPEQAVDAGLHPDDGDTALLPHWRASAALST